MTNAKRKKIITELALHIQEKCEILTYIEKQNKIIVKQMPHRPVLQIIKCNFYGCLYVDISTNHIMPL